MRAACPARCKYCSGHYSQVEFERWHWNHGVDAEMRVSSRKSYMVVWEERNAKLLYRLSAEGCITNGKKGYTIGKAMGQVTQNLFLWRRRGGGAGGGG
jgi:hypothetical protein